MTNCSQSPIIILFALSSFLQSILIMALDVLMFGGNGFIGSHVSESLLSHGHTLTLVNRDRWPWDTAKTIRAKVDKLVIADRATKQGVESFKRRIVTPRLSPSPRPFDLVIDLSAYDPLTIEPFYRLLGEHRLARWYVFLSSDSVYEVCLLDEQIRRGGRLIRESDAIRPADDSLARRDSYGHNKLLIEQLLTKRRVERPDRSVPFLILRLPDVLGSRDSTSRWWRYQMWMENFDFLNSTPIYIPSFAKNLSTSYVYVKDVARFLSLVADLVVSGKDLHKITDQTYNFALDRPKPVGELLLHIKQAAEARWALIEKSRSSAEGDTAGPEVFYFPSVTTAGLDTSKFRHNFQNFEMSDWTQIIHETVGFYKKAFIDYPRQRDETARQLCSVDLRLDDRLCENFLTQILVVAAKNTKQEL